MYLNQQNKTVIYSVEKEDKPVFEMKFSLKEMEKSLSKC